ncbi:MAG: glycosyltransferase family 2 protein [Sulfolobales archaeon]
MSREKVRKISIIVPLHREKKESIETTLRSIDSLNYPKELIDVVLVYRANDLETTRGVKEILSSNSYKIRVREYPVRRERGFKASDINEVLKIVDGEIIGFYDADNIIERDQVAKVLEMIDRGFSAVSPKVYRYRPSVLGRLILLESVLWYDLWVRVLTKLRLHTPLSGEGLYVKREVLGVLGGFPEILAEDAGLSLLLAMRDLKYGYVDSYVEELAPKNIVSFIKQRIRWYRGHFQALTLLFASKASLRVILRILLSYLLISITIILALSPLILSFYLTTILNERTIDPRDKILNTAGARVAMETLSVIALAGYSGFLGLSWVLLLKIHSKRKGLSESIKTILVSALLMPLYWILLSLIFIISLIVPVREWFKTERR